MDTKITYFPALSASILNLKVELSSLVRKVWRTAVSSWIAFASPYGNKFPGINRNYCPETMSFTSIELFFYQSSVHNGNQHIRWTIFKSTWTKRSLRRSATSAVDVSEVQSFLKVQAGKLKRRKSNFQYAVIVRSTVHFHTPRMSDISPKETTID